MPFLHIDTLKIYQFSIFEDQGLYHAVFTRRGGFSPLPWQSLNFGASVGDDLRRVTKNREIALSSLKCKISSVYDVYQVHSKNIVVTGRPLMTNEIHQKADAIITDEPNVTLMMRFADCVPILLYDPKKRVIGLVHAGWIGTVDKIAKATVMKMIDVFGSDTNDMIAAIGPSIGPDHYVIGDDVIERVESSFGGQSDEFLIERQSKVYFDLWKANQQILLDVGINNIEMANICTSCNLDDWYSHRGEHGKTGRFGIIFGLQK